VGEELPGERLVAGVGIVSVSAASGLRFLRRA
jgi:hypothetical protein